MTNYEKSLERRRLIGTRQSVPGPALFLDRDGVLIKEKHYISKIEDVELSEGAMELLASAHECGWPVIVVTNQSGISRGYFSWGDYERVTDEILHKIGNRSLLTAIYANGHGPDAEKESWRKPSPMMLVKAAEELNIDLSKSIMVGDRLTDIMAGAGAGVSKACHIKEGHGRNESGLVEEWFYDRAMNGEVVTHSRLFQFESLLDLNKAFKQWEGDQGNKEETAQYSRKRLMCRVDLMAKKQEGSPFIMDQ